MYPCCVRTLEWCCILLLLEGCSLLTVSYLNSCRMFAMLFSSPGVLLFTKHFTIYIFFFTDMRCLEKPKHWIQCWKRQNPEFQCLEKPKFTIVKFGKAKTLNSNVEKAKIQSSNVWISENTEMLFFEKQNSWIPMFAKCRTLNFNFFLKPKCRIPCNVWKKKNIGFQCLEKLTKSGKSNVWKR